MFTRFEQGGLMSPVVGADYRKWILEKGDMLDPLDLVRGFLGREPNSDAFFKLLGIQTGV
jgi:Zn-dependent oligopeptidase